MKKSAERFDFAFASKMTTCEESFSAQFDEWQRVAPQNQRRIFEQSNNKQSQD